MSAFIETAERRVNRFTLPSPVIRQLTGPTQINSPRMYLVDLEESAKVALKILERENLEV
jgi:hypothetical protein